MALFLLLCACCIPTSAAGASLTLKADKSAVSVGDTVTVTVNMSGNPGIASLDFSLYYEASKVQLLSPESLSNGTNSFFGMESVNPNTSGVIIYRGASTESQKNGTVLTVSFKVLKPNAKFSVGDLEAHTSGDPEKDNGKIPEVPVTANTLTLSCAHKNATSTQTKAPTCTAAGTKTVTCKDCGYSHIESVPALGHSFSKWSVTTKATCTEQGFETRTCTRCGVKETRATAKAAHTPGDWTVTQDATCTKTGKRVQHCTVCKAQIGEQTIPAKGHKIDSKNSEVVKKPTCTEPGEKRGKCSVCGETAAVEVIPALGHTYGPWVTTQEATCTKTGKQVRSCTVCQKQTDEKVIPAKGHSVAESAWKVTKEATCTQAGSREGKCSVCGETVRETLPALGHKVIKGNVIKEPTCTEAGEKQGVCTVCGEVAAIETIPALGHTFGEWVVTREATESEAGERERVCSVCGEKEVETLVFAADETAAVPVGGDLDTPSANDDTAKPASSVRQKVIFGVIGVTAVLAVSGIAAAITLSIRKKRSRTQPFL